MTSFLTTVVLPGWVFLAIVLGFGTAGMFLGVLAERVSKAFTNDASLNDVFDVDDKSPEEIFDPVPLSSHQPPEEIDDDTLGDIVQRYAIAYPTFSMESLLQMMVSSGKIRLKHVGRAALLYESLCRSLN